MSSIKSIPEYDELIDLYDKVLYLIGKESYEREKSKLEEKLNPEILLNKKLTDKLNTVSCKKLLEYSKFFAGSIQTGDIVGLPQKSTTECKYGSKCFRKGNLLHNALFSHPNIRYPWNQLLADRCLTLYNSKCRSVKQGKATARNDKKRYNPYKRIGGMRQTKKRKRRRRRKTKRKNN
jgi:hypothetical protein